MFAKISKFLAVSSVALATAALAMAQDAPAKRKSVEETLGARNVAILKNITKIEVLKLQYRAKKDEPAVFGFKVLASAEVSVEKFGLRLSQALLNEETYVRGNCSTQVALRLYSGEDFVEVLFCEGSACGGVRIDVTDLDGNVRKVGGMVPRELRGVLAEVQADAATLWFAPDRPKK